MVLRSAVELDLLELIKKAGPGEFVSPTELAAQLLRTTATTTENPAAHAMLDRILRLLASYSVLDCRLKTLSDGRVERAYGLTEVCKFLTKNEDGASMAPFLLMNQDRVTMESWYHVKDVVVEGGSPFRKAHGMEGFAYIGTDPRFNVLFNKAMSDHSRIAMKEIIRTYKGFEGLSTVVDVGGGIRASLNMIVAEYPSIKGINFDLPHVFREAPSYPGVEHVGGDMFVSVPKGDAIFMKWVSHILTDERCLELFKNCYEALPESGGKLILCKVSFPRFQTAGYRRETYFTSM